MEDRIFIFDNFTLYFYKCFDNDTKIMVLYGSWKFISSFLSELTIGYQKESCIVTWLWHRLTYEAKTLNRAEFVAETGWQVSFQPSVLSIQIIDTIYLAFINKIFQIKFQHSLNTNLFLPLGLLSFFSIKKSQNYKGRFLDVVQKLTIMVLLYEKLLYKNHPS